MRFIYKAKEGPEKTVQGVIEAANQDGAVAKIRQMGLVPVFVQKEPGELSEKAAAPGRKPAGFFFGRKVSKKHIYIFTKKLRVLLKSQEPILKSLYFLENQVAHGEFRKMIHAMIESVRDGRSFSESLRMFPRHFPPLYVSIVEAGEASGKLDYSLEQISKYLDDERKLSQKVISSLAYPAVMVTVGFATIVFIITFVVPKLKSLFEDFAGHLPLVTKILLDMSLIFSRYWMISLVLFMAFIAFVFYTRGAPWQKRTLGIFKKRIPVVKDIIYNQSLCRFSNGLSVLLASGVSMLDSIKMAIPLIDDAAAQKELKKAYEQIVTGSSLEESLRKNCAFLPDMFIKMVAVGETGGRLDEILADLTETYADEVETTTKIVTSLIEPVAILIVGGILSFIVIAILLPIFEMSLFIR
ncbi:MAG: hypothetical protein DRP85_06080 [Candidatus Makaraimicrobium thalassicum]|nr:MAG: hypothetical protein DRP85_06080 [Candidatus Omnitrophota bacterium]